MHTGFIQSLVKFKTWFVPIDRDPHLGMNEIADATGPGILAGPGVEAATRVAKPTTVEVSKILLDIVEV